MRHAGTQDIETPRLLLRRLLPEDAPQMYANWASDPEVTRYLRWEPHKSPAETRELLASWALLYPNPDYNQWAMVEKATGQVFGSISVYNALLGEPQQKTKWQGLELSGGIWDVPVWERVTVRIIPTGDEVLAFTTHPAPGKGQVVESNSQMLAALARELGCVVE